MASLLRTRLGCVGVVRATVFRAAQWQASGRPPVRGLSGSATVVRHLPLAGGRLGAVGLAIGAAVGAGGAVAVVLCDAPAVDEWTEHVDPSSGKTYYYNAKTQATVWEKPAPLLQAQVAVASTPQPVAAAPQPVAAAPQQAAAQVAAATRAERDDAAMRAATFGAALDQGLAELSSLYSAQYKSNLRRYTR